MIKPRSSTILGIQLYLIHRLQANVCLLRSEYAQTRAEMDEVRDEQFLLRL